MSNIYELRLQAIFNAILNTSHHLAVRIKDLILQRQLSALKG